MSLNQIFKKIKVIVLFLVGIFATILFFKIKNNSKLKQQMEYELERNKEEYEISLLESNSIVREQKLNELAKQKSIIEKNIKMIEEKDAKGEYVSIDELEKFFDDRGL